MRAEILSAHPQQRVSVNVTQPFMKPQIKQILKSHML